MRSILPILVAAVCGPQQTTSPDSPDAPAANAARVTIAAPARDFPKSITIDGRAVCGQDAKACPASKALAGGELYVSETIPAGQHEVRLYGERPDPNGTMVPEETARLDLVAEEGAVYVCRAGGGGCREQEAAAPAPAQAQLECYLNSDCEPSEQCRFGSCVPLCREDRDCDRDQKCALDSAVGWKRCV